LELIVTCFYHYCHCYCYQEIHPLDCCCSYLILELYKMGINYDLILSNFPGKMYENNAFHRSVTMLSYRWLHSQLDILYIATRVKILMGHIEFSIERPRSSELMLVLLHQITIYCFQLIPKPLNTSMVWCMLTLSRQIP
jgi:hypothetical protein